MVIFTSHSWGGSSLRLSVSHRDACCAPHGGSPHRGQRRPAKPRLAEPSLTLGSDLLSGVL